LTYINSFCFSYFSVRVSCFLPSAGLRPWSFYLCLSRRWDYRAISPCPSLGLISSVYNLPPCWFLNWIHAVFHVCPNTCSRFGGWCNCHQVFKRRAAGI
jgi:hypothetical protein